MTRRRSNTDTAITVFQLGSLTATLALTSCHACGRTNQGLTFCSERIGARGAAITVCTLCLADAMKYQREYLAAHPPRTL
jgi:hypothetical protein